MILGQENYSSIGDLTHTSPISPGNPRWTMPGGDSGWAPTPRVRVLGNRGRGEVHKGLRRLLGSNLTMIQLEEQIRFRHKAPNPNFIPKAGGGGAARDPDREVRGVWRRWRLMSMRRPMRRGCISSTGIERSQLNGHRAHSRLNTHRPSNP